MIKKVYITRCINSCQFYFRSMDGMECTHPYWKDKGAYTNMIIKQGDIIPEKCPLRKEDLFINIQYKLFVETLVLRS